MSRMRVAIGSLTLSAAALVGLAANEGYSEQAAIPVKGDVPTMGFGSTTHEDGRAVQLGDRTTPVKALQRTLAYTQKAEAGFKACIDVPLHQGEFDLYLDFAYQYGMPTLCSSTIAEHLRAQRYVQACGALLDYRFMTSPVPHEGWEVTKRDDKGRPVRWSFDCSTPGNKICRGVWTRQQERHQKCMEMQG
ncbi:glycoside hydrolase family protein [Pelomonas sp. BJYL3]|uniref:glycoside hydrolase family protein n=1 Tax=Pelomonas sp. BJYL3 TaxID=2976697 RepID=UPI0022B4F650|nr:lysozyme [Pelomonas sp. BJYL3]